MLSNTLNQQLLKLIHRFNKWHLLSNFVLQNPLEHKLGGKSIHLEFKKLKMRNTTILFLLLMLTTTLFSQEKTIVNHKLYVSLKPETSEISVIDSIEIQGNQFNSFQLNSVLSPESLSNQLPLKLAKKATQTQDVGMDRDMNNQEGIQVNIWKTKEDFDQIVIKYEGIINDQIQQKGENYQRSFSETSGIISDIGIYLAGATYWHPVFDNSLSTYELNVELPSGWKSVSQGKRILEETKDQKHTDIWSCNGPQEEIFLIGAEFNEYSYEMTDGVMAMAFLRTPDEALANKYLGVTEQYKNMYEQMIGKYPYTKFALVENFWETGYGMPSFTLLGEKVIRFPFILHSSYPHELLHNWWGNSVYVDFETGNWCEGITAFMADHLIKEQHQQGEEYRRSVLQKYTNYVNPENDFPLSEFLSRNSGATESIGYGKSLMVWQMLRRQLGDEKFLEGFQLFNKKYKYKVASYDNIRTCMEEVSGQDLKAFFDQWILRTGAPHFVLSNVSTSSYGQQYNISFQLQQNQDAEAFVLDIPVYILTENGLETNYFRMTQKTQNFQITTKSKPLKLQVDPQFDVFRTLDRDEVPAGLSKIWSSNNNLIILPRNTSKEQDAINQDLAQQWKATNEDIYTIVYDDEVESFSADQTPWIIGYNNKFLKTLSTQISESLLKMDDNTVVFDGNEVAKAGNSVVFTSYLEEGSDRQFIFMTTENKAAIPGLVRKLPHYGKYSYLGFKGEEPSNISKGQWPVYQSPLVYVFEESAKNELIKENREALAKLPVLFSEKKMMEDIKYLASEALKGRGLGTPELDLAADYIANEFEKAGLQKFNNSYFQNFKHAFKDKGEMNLKNVIGYIPGSDPKLKNEAVVISAHYDHLGMGWPDVHAGDEGKIHYGADDNASGVATITELARNMAKTSKPKRNIIFLACTAEEAGLIGSRYFVENIQSLDGNDIYANVNIDTDGSLFDKELLVLNANSAYEWKFIFMGTDYTTGIKSKIVEQPLDASDQVAFIEKGYPGIQLFTGPTPHYHRPSDTFEKIDGKGLVKVATFTKEVIDYLANRVEPLKFQGENKREKTASAPSSHGNTTRKVSTGIVPDFAFAGEGVKVGSVSDNSPAVKSGIESGDIVQKVNGEAVTGLRQYSDMLKQFKVGEEIEMEVLRGAETKLIKLVLAER